MYLKNYRWEIDGDLIVISINLDTIYTDSFPGFVIDSIYYGSRIKWFLYSMELHTKHEPFYSAPVIRKLSSSPLTIVHENLILIVI